jgi:hypothetical protein
MSSNIAIIGGSGGLANPNNSSAGNMLNVSGGNGSDMFYFSSQGSPTAPMGGNTWFGHGGSGMASQESGNYSLGSSGVGYGTGGGGSWALALNSLSIPGPNGTDGICIIYEYS